MANTQDSRAQFEKWCARKWGVVSSFVKGRYLDLDDQDRWEAYTAGAADENEACAILCENAENCSGELLHHDCHEQDAKAIRARQEQGKGKP